MPGRPPPPPYEMTPEDAAEKQQNSLQDQRCFKRTVQAFKNYAASALQMMKHKEKCVENLSEAHKKLLGDGYYDFMMKEVFPAHHRGIEANRVFLSAIVDASDTLFESYWPGGDLCKDEPIEPPTALDMDKVHSTLRQFVRDWSDEGTAERASVYDPMKQALEDYFGPQVDRAGRSRAEIHVLVPGAGLSRLSLEIALMGFSSQGNEFSYHMLIAGHYVLNHGVPTRSCVVSPFVDTTINVFRRSEQLRTVAIPDKTPMDAVEEISAQGKQFGDFSMIAGDFTEVYTKPHEIGAWDSVVTCFFIDTAHNIVEYLTILYNLLRPGGLWVNCGPLLYHFADTIGDASIDLTFEEVIAVAKNVGFLIDEEKIRVVQTTYTNNPYSMKNVLYRCPFFTAVKPLNAPKEPGASTVAAAPMAGFAPTGLQ